MSTKAFDFYIMDKKNINKYLLFIKNALGLCFIAHFSKNTELSKVLHAGLFSSYEEYKKLLPEINDAMQSQTYTDKDYFDLTAGVSVWIWNQYAVVKPYGFNGGFANVLKQPRYVKEFSYWNNTDKPDEIVGQEWGRRRRFFDKTIDTLPRMSYIPYDFLSRDSIHAVFDLVKEYEKYIKDKKKKEAE